MKKVKGSKLPPGYDKMPKCGHGKPFNTTYSNHWNGFKMFFGMAVSDWVTCDQPAKS